MKSSFIYGNYSQMDLHFKILPRFFSQMHTIIRQMLGRKLRHFLSSDTGLLTNTLATWCEKLTHWKRPWCWERLKAGEEEDDRGWDVWMASQTQWTWVWVSSGSWWWTGKPGVLQSTGSQTAGHDWATELNWTEPSCWRLCWGPKRDRHEPTRRCTGNSPYEGTLY